MLINIIIFFLDIWVVMIKDIWYVGFGWYSFVLFWFGVVDNMVNYIEYV